MSRHMPNCKPVHTDQNLNGFHLGVYYYSVIILLLQDDCTVILNSSSTKNNQVNQAMASVSSGSRDFHQGEVSMEEEAREMSRLAAKAADMFSRAVVAAQRSRCAAEAARRSRRAAVAWEIFSRAGKDSYRRMRAMVHTQMDHISGWARL